MRVNILIITLFMSMFVFTGCSDESNEAKTIIEDNSSFDDLKKASNKTYTLKTTDNQQIVFNLENNVLTSKQLNGKVTIFNFWATWCKSCIEEMPLLNELYAKHSDKFNLIGVLFKDKSTPEQIDSFIEKYDIKFPVTVGDSEDDRLAYYFDDIKMIPETFVFDKDGKFLKKFIGIVDEKVLESYITK